MRLYLPLFILLFSFQGALGQTLEQFQATLPTLGYLPTWEHRSTFEKNFFKNWETSGTFDTLSMLLIPDTLANDGSRELLKNQLRKIFSDLEKQKIRGRANNVQLKRIITYLRKNYFEEYKPYSSFLDIVEKKEYNALNASVLLSFVLDRFGIPYEIKTNPIFTFVEIDPEGKKEVLDFLDPNAPLIEPSQMVKTGFVGFLVNAGYASRRDVELMGIENLYFKYAFPEKNMSYSELTGMQYFTIAIGHAAAANYEQAIHSLEQAYLFFPSLAIKYNLFEIYSMAIRKANFEEDRSLDWLVAAYQLVPSKASRETMVANFKALQKFFLGQEDNPERLEEIFQYLSVKLNKDSSLISSLTQIHYLEMAKLAAQSKDYSGALKLSAKVIPLTAETEQLMGFYLRNLLLQVSDCAARKGILDSYLDQFPFLASKKGIDEPVVECK